MFAGSFSASPLPTRKRATSNPNLDSDEKWLDVETKRAGQAVCSSATDFIHLLASDPSVAHFRVGQHIRRSIPAIVSRSNEVSRISKQVEGATEDLHFAMRSLDETFDMPTFKSIHSKLVIAVALTSRLLEDDQQQKSAPPKPAAT
eukprot:Sspe_Gene.146::Locus_46_Transcript_1_2_Confidence_0.667_Length_1879::g.146::m.146/K20822/MEF2BNB, BORCS8; BLOC-1 related complex subunit 8